MADLGGRPFPSRVVLFVTCLGDMFYPEVGEATVRLLHRLGIAVDFPLGQTCCGQPACNAGFHQQAREVARRNLTLFANAEYVVIPSGSCTSMWHIFYPELFADDPSLGEQADVLAARTYPMSSQEAFLDRVRRAMHKEAVGQSSRAPWLWHDSDSSPVPVALRTLNSSSR